MRRVVNRMLRMFERSGKASCVRTTPYRGTEAPTVRDMPGQLFFFFFADFFFAVVFPLFFAAAFFFGLPAKTESQLSE